MVREGGVCLSTVPDDQRQNLFPDLCSRGGSLVSGGHCKDHLASEAAGQSQAVVTHGVLLLTGKEAEAGQVLQAVVMSQR